MFDPEDGEEVSSYDEDRNAGRLEWQKKHALAAKKVRQFLITHPGANTVAIREGTGIDNVAQALAWLQKRGFVKNTFHGPEVIPL